MTDDIQQKLDNPGEPQRKPGTFKPGFDERRWLKGRPRVPKDAAKLMNHLLWEIASEEIENPKTGEKVDRLRALLRSLTTSKHSADKKEFLDRLAGKVADKVDVTSNGETIGNEDRDTRSEILRKLDSIAAATGAGAIPSQPDRE